MVFPQFLDSLNTMYSATFTHCNVQCLFNSGPMCSFVFVCCHRGEAIVIWSPEINSYSGELLTARTAVKMKTYFLKSPNGVLISYSERCSHTWHSKRFDARRLAQTGMRFFRRVRSSWKFLFKHAATCLVNIVLQISSSKPQFIAVIIGIKIKRLIIENGIIFSQCFVLTTKKGLKRV